VGKTFLSVTIRISGAHQTLRAFKQMPDDATTELRTASLKIAELLAAQLKVAATVAGAQTGLMAPTVRAKKDRVPVVQAGGTRRVGSNRVPAYKVLFGGEFGSHSLKQYPAFNSEGYWFFQSVKRDEPRLASEWTDAVDTINRKWAT